MDASTLVEQRTGVANYIYQILVRLVSNKNWQFILYSNKQISFPKSDNVRLEVHLPYRKGPLWLNTQALLSIKRDNLDLFWGGNGYLPVWLPTRTTSLLTIHDLVYLQAGATMPLVSRWSRRLFQPMSVKMADSIVAVSNATADEMLTHNCRSPNAIINPQVNDEYGIASKNEINKVIQAYSLDNRYLLALGTLEPRKNLAVLVRAYLKVRGMGIVLPKLVIAGGKGWLEGELPLLISKGEKAGFIQKLGYVSDGNMKGLYAGAEAFIFPSIHEGFGMPVLEAQLCGTPVLISDIPSLLEASGEVACTFRPTEQGIVEVLKQYAENELPLTCRLRRTITNNPQKAVEKMIELIEKTTGQIEK